MLNIYTLILLFFCTPVIAGSDALDLFYENTDSFTANFNQIISDRYAKEIERSTGNLIIKRPNKFVLNYLKPDQQHYISNGKTLWIYDVELEQVTIKKADEKLLNSPALLISSNRNIRDSYHVKEGVNYDKPEQDVFILTPKVVNDDSSMMFSIVQLTFLKGLLMEIKMTDNFDQITRLELSQQKLNPTVDADVFSFKIPDHVDVIGTIN